MPETPPPDAGPAHAVLDARRRSLDPIFAPRSLAVIGATEKAGGVGRSLLWNLIRNPFGGTVYPVNPGRPNVLGIRAYPSIAAVPEPVDLAVIATPAPTVPDLVDECVEAGVRGAIIISSGFREAGPEGLEREREVIARARRGRMRVVGPNSLGVMRPPRGLNATFAGRMALPGNVGLVSQSGALLTAILDWSHREHVGFSTFVSVGSMADVGWGDLIDYLGDDPDTKSIVIYMETIGDARAFLSAAREVALTKPIIVIKAGRSEPARQAAETHTGGLAGSDEVLDAAFRRSGVLRVNAIADVFYMAEVLSKQPRPRGPRLAIVTNAGGPGILALDALVASGGEPAALSGPTLAALDAGLPTTWSRGNPVDIQGDAGPERFAHALKAAAADPAADGLLVVLAPQSGTDPEGTAEALRPFARLPHKPVLASWMGGAEVADGEAILNTVGIPTFPYPDTGARVFSAMWRYTRNLRALYETPSLPDGGDGPVDRSLAAAILAAARARGRTILPEADSKAVLACYGIPCVRTEVAADADDAARLAREVGYPVVLKLHSETITRKDAVEGVRLDLHDEAAVRAAYAGIEASVAAKAGPGHFLGVSVQPMIRRAGVELIVGSSLDPDFGPVLLFGTGGRLVDVHRDRAVGLPPLNSTLARRLMERTRIFAALDGSRGRPGVALAALEQLLVRFSQLIVEQPTIRELDINPLLASPEGLLALDARVIAHDPGLPDDALPRPAIRPYPSQYAAPFTLKDGTEIMIRPIRPEDEPLLVAFHGTLSERSVALRYFHAMKLSQRTAHERLTRICFNDYDRELALVAEGRDALAGGARAILGVGRLSKLRESAEAEFAMLISDRYQNLGLGTELLRRLIAVGRAERLGRIRAEILPDNREMQAVCRKLGFRLERTIDADVVRGVLELA